MAQDRFQTGADQQKNAKKIPKESKTYRAWNSSGMPMGHRGINKIRFIWRALESEAKHDTKRGLRNT